MSFTAPFVVLVALFLFSAFPRALFHDRNYTRNNSNVNNIQISPDFAFKSNNFSRYVENLEQCLLGYSDCEITRDCSKFLYTEDCLSSRIPIFTSTGLISCCFRCCYIHTMTAYGLRDNVTAKPVYAGGLLNSLLMSPATISAISDALYSPFDFAAAKPSIYKIVTAMGSESAEKIVGRNIVLVLYLNNCGDISIMENIASRRMKYSNSKILKLHSNQLVCGTDRGVEFISAGENTSFGHLVASGSRDVETILKATPALDTRVFEHWQRRTNILSCACLGETDMGLAERLRANGFTQCRVFAQEPAAVSYNQSSLYSSRISLHWHFQNASFPHVKLNEIFDKIYKNMRAAKFVLSTSAPQSLGSCEWEAIVLGSIPILHESVIQQAPSLYNDLPVLGVSDFFALTPKILLRHESELLQDLFQNRSKYSVAKAYLPYWLKELTQRLLGGAYLRRFLGPTLNHTAALLSDRGINCASIYGFSGRNYSVGSAARIAASRNWVAGNASTAPPGRKAARWVWNASVAAPVAAAENVHVDILRHANTKHRSRLYGTHTHMSANMSGTQEQPQRLHAAAVERQPNRSKHASRNRRSYRRKRNSMNISAGTRVSSAPAADSTLPRHSDLQANTSLLRSRKLLSASRSSEFTIPEEFTASANDSKNQNADATAASANLPRRHSHRPEKFPFDKLLSTSLVDGHRAVGSVEVVIPRCCEKPFELGWVQQLLLLSPSVTVSIYYKCPFCVPRSLADIWAPQILANETLMKVVRRRGEGFGIRIIDDSFLFDVLGEINGSGYGGSSSNNNNNNNGSIDHLFSASPRVWQLQCFDTYYNGKEATAYLTHIIGRYHSLAGHTFFLHADPGSHIHLDLLSRSLIWTLRCKEPVSFLPLAALYLGGEWGRCCGEHGICKRNLFRHLGMHFFAEENPDIGAYKAGLFLASSNAIRARPIDFWRLLKQAIDGTTVIPGCPENKGNWARGPQIGGQIERMWHMFFGRPAVLPGRKLDRTLPSYLRVKDCAGVGKCGGAV